MNQKVHYISDELMTEYMERAFARCLSYSVQEGAWESTWAFRFPNDVYAHFTCQPSRREMRVVQILDNDEFFTTHRAVAFG